MEQVSEKKKDKRSVPIWLLLVLCCIIVAMALVISFFVLLHLDIIRCVPKDAPTAQATAEATLPASNDPKPQANDTEPPQTTEAPATPEPADTEAPTEKPTAEPTEKPTAEPTAKPTAEPTKMPDYFMFGGQKIKVGETKIDGKKRGINGKNKKLRHIPENEVADLVLYCPALEQLELEYCYMDDYTPLGKLTKLETLKLAYCGAGDGNAIKNIDWVKNLTELHTLNLGHNKINDTTAIAGLTKLTYLHLSDNSLEDEDLKPIGNLTNLETLYLYDLNKITDVSPLSKLTKLTFLHLGHNSKLKSIKSLTTLKKLKYLRLNETKFSDLSYIGKFSSLKKLDIEKCPINTDTVKHIRECKKLEKIVIDMGNYDLYNAILDEFYDGFQLQFLYQWSES